MVTFQVPDMTCGHCASTIAKAVARVDSTALVEFDMPNKLVRISAATPTAELAQVIQQAGYTPQPWQAVPSPPLAASRARGACCGGRRKAAAGDAQQRAGQAAASCCG